MHRLISCAIGDMHWHIAPEYRELLLGAAGLRIDDWLRQGQAKIVKDGPHRTVYHVVLPELDCFIKRNRVHDTRAWLRQLVRPAKSRIEFDHALLVAGRGINTITPLGVGEGRTPKGESFLVTRGLANTTPLGEFLEQTLPGLPEPRQSRLRRRLAQELARFVARMHETGVRHDDLHPGNFLLRLEADDEPRFFLIDLHAVRLGDRLDWDLTQDNLVLLNRWFSMRAARSDRARFWHSYCQSRGWRPNAAGVGPRRDPSRPQAKDRARELEQATIKSNLLLWHSRDQRCLKNNRYFEKLNRAETVGHAVRGLDHGWLEQLQADADAPFARDDVKVLKSSRSSTVIEMETNVDGRSRPLIYKRFRVTHWSEPWQGLVRRTPVLRSWLFGHGLISRGLPTPLPLLVLHRRRSGLDHEGYLLTEKIDNARELHDFVAELGELAENNRRRCVRLLIDRLARLIRTLHQRRLTHRDLKAANILVTGAHDDPQLWFVDLVGIAHAGKQHGRRCRLNLARLNASFLKSKVITNADRLRFLAAYRQWGLHGKSCWKDWWHKIAEATQRKVARNQKSGRPLA